jgi:uncharacterized protein DUF4333
MTPPATTRRATALFIALFTFFALAACGSVVDDAATEKGLKAEIPKLAEADMKVTSVTCPKDQDFVKGAVMTCDYTVEDGSKGTATVTITSAEGDGKTEYAISRYASGQVEQYLMESWDGDAALTAVTCPKKLKGEAVCTFEDDDGDTGTINVTFDDKGGYETKPQYD